MTYSYDEWACPLNRVIVGFSDDGDNLISEIYPCDATLHLVWTFDWPLSADKNLNSIIFPDDMPAYAYTHGWKVVCENGHTLAQYGNEAQDYAEPFAQNLIMKTIGAIKVTRNG